MNIGGMVLIFVFIISVYGSANFYIGKRIFQCLRFIFPHMNGAVYIGIYGFAALTLILGYFPLPFGIQGVMGWLGSYWMGIFAYLFMFFVVADLLILLGNIIKIIPTPVPQTVYFCAGLIVILLTIGVVSYGIYNANQIKYVSYEVKTKETTMAADMKIVLISDLHLGAVNSERHLEEIVQGINDLEPDIVCMAGDIFNDDYNAIRNPDKASDLLKGIRAKYGVFASLGNHDGGKTFNEFIRFFERSNIRLLNDEYVIINDQLILFGRVDGSPIGGFGELRRRDVSEIITSLDTDLPIVVMDHNPVSIKEYGEEVDLILAGHTHKGQIFPANLVTNALFVVDYGYYQKDSASPHVIVSSGVGTWGMPMRVGSNREIVSITLK